MNAAGEYEPPFAPVSRLGDICMCICCGAAEKSALEISAYPSKWVPPGWSINTDSKAIRCAQCKDFKRFEPEFHRNNEVWIDHQTEQEARFAEIKGPSAYRRHRDKHVSVRGEAPPPKVGRAQNKESEMEDEIETQDAKATPTRGERFKKQNKDAASAVGKGLLLASANEVGETLIDIAKELTSEIPAMQLVLEHPDGREVAKVIVAWALHAGTAQSNLIPQGEFVGEACQLQMTASTLALVAPRMGKIRKHLLKLAKVGKEVSTGIRVEEDAGRDDSYQQMEADLASMKAELAQLRAGTEVEATAKSDRKSA